MILYTALTLFFITFDKVKDFIVVRRSPFFDIVGTVNTTREHLHTLTVSLYNSHADDASPIKSVSLGSTTAFIFSDVSAKADTSECILLFISLSKRGTVDREKILYDCQLRCPLEHIKYPSNHKR